MSETDYNAQGQEMQTSKLAKVALVWSICSGIVLFLIASFYTNYAWGLLPLTGLALGIASLHQIKRSRGRLIGYPSAILAIAINSIFVTLITVHGSWGPPKSSNKVLCGVNLRGLGAALRSYATDNGGKYPTADTWCDLFIRYGLVTQKLFVCREALRKGDEGKCHYAINPNAKPRSPSDVVLLFETKGGWNQFGGPELLTTENHEGKGCNILFNNGSVRFVRTEELGELKWKVEDSEK